jgi:reductive dehalogenase
MSRIVKRAATFFGASLVGITNIDPAWLYQTKVNLYSTAIQERQGTPFEEMELSPIITNAIVMAVEMDADGIANAPNYLQFAAAGLGYSKMSVYIAMMAQFIRNLGYQAIPCANDTGLSIPLAIDAGLGALGRNGLLITRKFGPRVRLCKVLTDLPLACDEPDAEFIAELTETCKGCRKCADVCAVKAISNSDEPDYTTHSVSNNPGVKKWYVDVEKCYGEWVNITTDCGKCIQACPFSQISTKGSPTTFWK